MKIITFCQFFSNIDQHEAKLITVKVFKSIYKVSIGVQLHVCVCNMITKKQLI